MRVKESRYRLQISQRINNTTAYGERMGGEAVIRFAVFSDLHCDHVWDADRRIVELIKQIRSQHLFYEEGGTV